MGKRNTNHRRNKIGAEASYLLRAERGAISLIARKIGVSRQTVSRVARGEKTSERVRVAIVQYLLARGRKLGTAAFLIENAWRR